MSEYDYNYTPKDEIVKDTYYMCKTCIHKDYCQVAHKKEHWCGNHITNYDLRRINSRRY